MTVALALADARERDPTGTVALRRTFRAAGKLRMNQLRAQMRVAIMDYDVLGFGGPLVAGSLAAQPVDVRLRAFAGWLQASAGQVLGGPWLSAWMAKAWASGEHAGAGHVGHAPVGESSAGMLELARIELDGIVAAVIQQVVREAARSLARARPKRQLVWRRLARVFDKVGPPRIMALANTLTVMAHNHGRGAVYRAAGYHRVGVVPESMAPRAAMDAMFVQDLDPTAAAALLNLPSRAKLQREFEETEVGVLTAGDDKVCQACEEFAEGAPYDIDEVLDVLPMHVHCRCAIVPWHDKRYAQQDFDPGEHPRGYHGWWTEKGMVASRNITAKRVKGAESYVKSFTRPDVAAMRENPANFKHDVNLFSNANAYPNFREGELHGSADDRVQTIIGQFKSNLRFIYDNASEAMKHSGMSWYDKAHDIAVAEGNKYGIDERSSAAVIATLSPQKDWDQNIYLAHAVLEINAKQQGHLWDDEMETTAAGIWKPKDHEIVNAVRGKTLGQLSDPVEKAVWIRTYDEAHSDRSYRSFDTGEVMMTAKGVPAKAAWQATPAIASAVAAMDSKGDLDVISDVLGEKHKVRSFYNNIVAPQAPNGDVTVDTHAVGAALLRSLSGKAAAVMHALATNPKGEKPPGWQAPSKSAITGLSGTYAIYADAYRAVAADVGILPQQLQAITWQAKRALFDISDAKKIAIEHEWIAYHGGRQDLSQTQQNVLSIARG